MYNKKTHIHFAGIGGIGMSGIAKILKKQGYYISGCDLDLEQKSAIELKHLGCTLYKGNNTLNCKDSTIDILVYSSDIKDNHPEIIAAQERGIPTIRRAIMLAELMRTKYSIAIAGAHGKTTTTSLISHLFIEAQKDPTVIIGGHLKSISSNAQLGSSDFLIAEADESDRSFLRLYPTIAVVTNIDLEHLDVYQDIEDIKNTYQRFLGNLPFYGKAIVCGDDPYIREILPLAHIKTIKYGIESKADYVAHNIHLEPDHVEFSVVAKNEPLGSLKLTMPGRHNVLNALAAVAVAQEFGISFESIAKALASFKGIERRFSFKGNYKGIDLFDDYGHHPTEIFHALAIARHRARNKLIVFFQPHRYTRTQKLWSDFIRVLLQAPIDHLIITDIHAASEAPIAGITSEAFTHALKHYQPAYPISYVPFEYTFDSMRHELDKIAQAGDLVLLLGAGKINRLADVVLTQEL